MIDTVSFKLDAQTELIDDTGRFAELLKMARKTMYGDRPEGVGVIKWGTREYHWFEAWILDHSHTTKGMQYFSPYAGEMVELFAAAQKANGMIWSFAFPDKEPQHQYHYWAYHDQGYAVADGGVLGGFHRRTHHRRRAGQDRRISAAARGVLCVCIAPVRDAVPERTREPHAQTFVGACFVALDARELPKGAQNQ